MRAKKFLLGMGIIGLSTTAFGITAVAETNYYSSITNTTSGTTLASDLHSLLASTHTNQLSYNDLWSAYYTSDVLPGTKIIWDIYSECIFTAGDDQDQGNHSAEGDKYNREHTTPQSWFNKESPMVADAHHIFATDAYVNGQRSNYPFGEVGSATYTSHNGGKLGSSSFSGYSDKVFEPIDEYKGDIARAFMYMAIRYSNVCGSWSNGANVVYQSSYPYLTNYAKNIFTKWAHEDPVSDKEYIRNEALFNIQHDRNPFIDHPEYIDVIWTNSYTDQPTNTRYSANDVVNAISSLTSSSSNDTVYLTYEKYCRLNTSDKELVTNANTLFSRVESLANTTNLASYWDGIINRGGTQSVDQTKVDNVISLIAALPDTITLSDEAAVNSANTAYQALNSAEKKAVTNYAKLSAAISTIEALNSQTQIQNVISLINTLPSTITESDVELVNQVATAYNQLPNGAKAEVTNYAKLQDALAQVEALNNKTYELVTDDTTLKADDEIIITAANYDKAIGGVTGKYYRAGVSITKEDNTVTLANDNTEVNKLTLVAGTTNGSFGLYNGSEYLAASSAYTNLVGVNSIDDYSSWTISIDSNGNATITAVGETTKSGTFHCSICWDVDHNDFSSVQSVSSNGAVQIYKLHTNNGGGGDVPPVVHYAHEDFAKLATKSSLKFNYNSTTTLATGDGSYHLVTSVDALEDGSEIIIANIASNKVMGTLNGKIASAVDVSATNDVISNAGTALVFTIVKNSDGSISLKSGEQYLSSTVAKNISLSGSNDTDATKWNITMNSSNVAAIASKGVNANLQYNSGSPRFTTYATSSNQSDVKIYKLSGSSEKTTYTYSNVYLRYGTGLSKELYDALLEEGTEVSFGVAVSVNGTTFTNYTFNPVRVASIGAKTEDQNGEFYQFFAVMPVGSANFETVVTAKCFVTIDGVTYYSKSAAYSVDTLVAYYISNASSLGLTEAQLAVLGGF
ncbi:MAG: endonuclease [Acholeplasmatales bacterium]|nr:endonuclease [Acholeplasmatales bacterium]